MSAFEKHYTVKDIGKMWHLSETVVRKLFRDEPGVIRIDAPERRFKRGYCSLRIPESIAERVHARLGRST